MSNIFQEVPKKIYDAPSFFFLIGSSCFFESFLLSNQTAKFPTRIRQNAFFPLYAKKKKKLARKKAESK